MPIPLTVTTFLLGRPFENLPEAICRITVHCMFYDHCGSEFIFVLDLIELKDHTCNGKWRTIYPQERVKTGCDT